MTVSVKKTKSAVTLAQLEKDIYSGVFPPNKKLPTAELMQRYQISTTTLREALSRLVIQGLVIEEPLRGFKVAPLSIEELRDIYQTRIFIECRAFELSLEQATPEWEAEVMGICHRLSKLVETDEQVNEEEWAALHSNFHATLVKNCPSPWLLKIQKWLYQQTERYRRYCLFQQETKLLLHKAQIEHSNIVAAIIEKDTKKALELMHEHLQFAVHHVEQRLRKQQSESDTP